MNWRRLFLLLAFLASCGRAYAQPTGSTPPNPCLNVLTCAQTRVHSKRRIYIEPTTTTGTGTVTVTSGVHTTINCGTTACDFRGVEPGDAIIVGSLSNVVNTVATSACPVTGSNANCRVITRDPGVVPAVTNSAWSYKKAALYVPHANNTTQQAVIISPDGELYVGQPASCLQAPCSPHAVFGVTQADVGSNVGRATTGQPAQQVFRVVGGKGESYTTDTGGSGRGGVGASITLGSGAGGDAVGYDIGGDGGQLTFTSGAGGALSTGTTGQGGAGGAFAFNGGVGGAVPTGSTASMGGTGATITIAGGAGGTAVAGNTNGNGGNVVINAGLAGAGAGTAGSDGSVVLGSNNTVVAVGGGTAGGLFAVVEPSGAGSNVVLLTGVAMSGNMIVPAVTVAVGGAAYAHSMYGGL